MESRSPSPLIDPQLTDWLKDRARAVAVHRWFAVRCFVATMAIVTVALLIWPRTYHSQAKLFVRLGRESVALDPTVTAGATISVSDTREQELNSVMEMIANRAVLEDVVRVLGADVVLGEASVPSSAEVDQQLADAFSRPSAMPLAAEQLSYDSELAIKHLEAIVSSDLPKKSSVINLTCKAESPEIAQTILKVFLAAFQSQHVRAHRTDQSFPFFVEQSELLRRELEQATTELVTVKNELGVVSLDERRRAIEDELTRLRRELQETQAASTATQASLDDLRQKQVTLPEWRIAEEVNGQPDDAVGSTRRTLYDLQIRERDLLTRYTPQHPLVLATRRQISQAEQLLTGTPASSLAETTRSPDPRWQQVELQKLATESELEALHGKTARLEQQLTDLRSDREHLNREEGRIRRLQQQVDVLQGSYGEYLNKREQSRIAQALGQERISNVNVIQPASYVSQPVSPKRTLIFALATFVAAFGGIGAALARDAFAPAAVLQPNRTRSGAAVNPRGQHSQGCDDAIERATEMVEAARY